MNIVRRHAKLRWLLPLSAASALAIATWSPRAMADGPTPAPPQTVANGDQVITVPAGCNAATQANGQMVIICPTPVAANPAAASVAPPPPAGAPNAGPVGPLAPAPPVVRNNWYGWQVLLADGSWLVLGPALGSSNKTAEIGATISVGGYLLGGPIVHAAHGNPGAALGSLGLRLALPLGGGLLGGTLGYAVFNGSKSQIDYGGLYGFYFGFLVGGAVGMITAVVCDVAALSNEKVTVTAPAQAKRKGPGFRIFPTANLGVREQTVGVQGTF
jgi:hypothetical protein